MQFVVPQFIEVESKIIGPISVRQFIILLTAGGMAFLYYEIFSFWLFAILSLATIAVAGVFAFVKINSQPFHTFALSAIQTAKRPALATWRHETETGRVVTKMSRKDKRNKDESAPMQFTAKPQVSESHLAELSLIVDTGGKYSPQDIERLLQEQRAKTEPPISKVDTNK